MTSEAIFFHLLCLHRLYLFKKYFLVGGYISLALNVFIAKIPLQLPIFLLRLQFENGDADDIIKNRNSKEQNKWKTKMKEVRVKRRKKMN